MNQSIKQMLAIYEQHIFGQTNNLKLILTALLSGGHVLLEGVPGIGKTKMVRTLALLINGDFKRIQFTPDLLPSDITGTMIFNTKTGNFETLKGPIFANILLGDEINRTPPKTQAALLEAMEEKQVTIHGKTYALPDPFFVVATQNPIEYEGTYPLPEAQKDRFMFKLQIDYPDLEAEKLLLQRSQEALYSNTAQDTAITSPFQDTQSFKELMSAVNKIVVEDSLITYIASLVRQTRISELVRLGASPRSGISIMASSKAWAFIHGRDFVTPDDVKTVIRPALRHRIIPTPQVELEGGTSDQIIQDIVAKVEVPR